MESMRGRVPFSTIDASGPAFGGRDRPEILVKSTLLGTVLFLLVAACRSAPPEPDATVPSRDCVFLQLKSGPRSESISKEEAQTVFAGHFANMQRLAEAGQLLVAGPYGTPKRDASLRGVLILSPADVDGAQALAATDPGVIAGVFRTEAIRMRTRAPLDKYLEHELALRAQDQAEGRKREPGDSLRAYVWLTAEHGRRAWQGLLDMDGILLWGELADGRALALVDAKDVDACLELMGERSGQIGPFVMDPWFGSRELEKLPELAHAAAN
jgi:uncharacterized protein YciI